ncbi:hypothetical protein HDU96_010342 [Phlyctochytrium bullatum]|nr:hypothetical protein HDU96_010342 [Phlyctochytrium bullatum]
MSIQWGGSDVAVNPAVYTNQTLVALPAVAGAIAVAHYIPELLSTTPPLPLRLSRNVLPQIFVGNITTWNDPAILNDQLPAVAAVLANVSRPIRLVVRNPGSGTSSNFVRFLRLLNPNVPAVSSWSGAVSAAARSSLINARTNIAVGNIVASIPYTITYMDAQELLTANGGSLSMPPAAAHVQNARSEYVLPSLTSLRTAFENLTPSTVASIDVKSSALSVLDPNVAGAYPISIVTNFVIRLNNISPDPDVATWTLRFLWWCLASPAADESYSQTQFLSLRNTAAGNLSLSYIRGYTYTPPNGSPARPLYGVSICDAAAETSAPNPCVNGKCTNTLPFQPEAIKCVCEAGYRNYRRADCSEPVPFLDLESPVVVIQLVFAVLALAIVAVTSVLVVINANDVTLKAISPRLSQVVLLGCFIGALGIVLYAASPLEWTCRIRIYFPSVAFGLVFGILTLKTYRIYLVSGYKTSLRVLSDTPLIAFAFCAALVEVSICLANNFTAKPIPRLIRPNTATVLAKDESFVTCGVPEGNEGVQNATDLALYLWNAALLILAIVFASKTRGTAKKFAESKAIAMVTYLVAVFLTMGLPVIYAIPNNSRQTASVVSLVRAFIMFVLTTAAPIVLFGGRLWKILKSTRNVDWADVQTHSGEGSKKRSKTGSQGGQSGSRSNANMFENATMATTTYEVGVCKNRFGSAWFQATLIVLPDLDLVLLVPAIPTENGMAFNHSKTALQVSKEVDTPTLKTISGRSLANLQDEEEASGENSATSHSTRRQALIRPEGDKAGWTLEFASMKMVKDFKEFYEADLDALDKLVDNHIKKLRSFAGGKLGRSMTTMGVPNTSAKDHRRSQLGTSSPLLPLPPVDIASSRRSHSVRGTPSAPDISRHDDDAKSPPSSSRPSQSRPSIAVPEIVVSPTPEPRKPSQKKTVHPVRWEVEEAEDEAPMLPPSSATSEQPSPASIEHRDGARDVGENFPLLQE